MQKSFTYRIYLTKGQRRILEHQLEACRWVYNETLAERKRAYKARGASLRLYDTQAWLPVWKLTRPALKRVQSQVLQNVSVRVDLVFQAFFRRAVVPKVPLDVLPDHVHLVVDCPPIYAPQQLANHFKGSTARILRDELPQLRSRLQSLWSRSYYVGSAGQVSTDTI
jgi:REP element-mobilizing transposase RayT